MSLAKLGARAGKIARDALSTRRNMSNLPNYTIPDRITLYEVPKLITPSDIRRAIAGRAEGVMDVQIDYKGFRPSGKAMITVENPEHLAKNLRALKPLFICGMEVRPVAHYSLDPSQIRDSKDPNQAVKAFAEGNGPGNFFPNRERTVVLWGMPGKTTINDVATALVGFKAEKKDGKPIIEKLDKPEGKFTIFSRFVVTMASVSEARRLARTWHMTPWNPKSLDLIRAQVLH